MKKHKWEQDQIAHMKEYIARFGHGSAKLARQAQSKEKTLEKMVRCFERVPTDNLPCTCPSAFADSSSALMHRGWASAMYCLHSDFYWPTVDCAGQERLDRGCGQGTCGEVALHRRGQAAAARPAIHQRHLRIQPRSGPLQQCAYSPSPIAAFPISF